MDCGAHLTAVVPSFQVSLDDVLERRHLPPLGLKDFEEWLLDLAHYQFIQMRGLVAVQRLEEALQRLLGLRPEGHALPVDLQIATVECRAEVLACPGFLLCDHGPIPLLLVLIIRLCALKLRAAPECRIAPRALPAALAASRSGQDGHVMPLVPDVD